MHTHSQTLTHTHLNTQHLRGHGGGTLEGASFRSRVLALSWYSPLSKQNQNIHKKILNHPAVISIPSERARQVLVPPKLLGNTSIHMHTHTHMHTHAHACTLCTLMCTCTYYTYMCAHTYMHTLMHTHAAAERLDAPWAFQEAAPEIKQNLTGLSWDKSPSMSPFLVCRKKAVSPLKLPGFKEQVSQLRGQQSHNRAPSSSGRDRGNNLTHI